MGHPQAESEGEGIGVFFRFPLDIDDVPEVVDVLIFGDGVVIEGDENIDLFTQLYLLLVRNGKKEGIIFPLDDGGVFFVCSEGVSVVGQDLSEEEACSIDSCSCCS